MQSQGMQVVLVPCPLQGHLTPMLELGTILHSNGFSVVIMHAIFNVPDPRNYSDFIFRPIMENLTDLDTSPENLSDLIKTLNTHGGASLKKRLTEMMVQHEPGHDKVACIIYDTLMFFSDAVAKDMTIPSFILQPTSGSAIRAYSVLPSLYEQGYIPFKDSMLEELVPGLHPVRFKDLSLSNVGKLEDLMPIVATVTNTGSASAIIWNTFHDLEHSALLQLRQVYSVPLFPIGPLHKMAPTSSTSLLKEDTSCITWLDKQAPSSVIYVSVGSLASLDATEVAEMAWGLADSKQPFLWVVRPGSVRDSEWIEFLPEGFKEEIGERGYIVKWAPQKEVLAHAAVGGFWSHCGWNSTLESIGEGVPMICMPCFADQKINARYLSHEWRVGLHLEQNPKRGDIVKAIKLLMVDKEGEELRLRANAMKEKVDLSVKTDGTSHSTLNDLLVFILSL